MILLDQRVHTKCQEVGDFPLARRPFLGEHLSSESPHFTKVYNEPKTSWCFALAKLGCGRSHYDFARQSDSNSDNYSSCTNMVSLLPFQ